MRRFTKALTGLAALCIVLSFTPCKSMENDETADVVVVGAGVSGETAALELKAKNPSIKVVLLEKQARTALRIRIIGSSKSLATSRKSNSRMRPGA